MIFAARMLLDWAACDVPEEARNIYMSKLAATSTTAREDSGGKLGGQQHEVQENSNGGGVLLSSRVAKRPSPRHAAPPPPHGSGLIVETSGAVAAGVGGSGFSQSMTLDGRMLTRQVEAMCLAKTAPSRSPSHLVVVPNSDSANSSDQAVGALVIPDEVVEGDKPNR